MADFQIAEFSPKRKAIGVTSQKSAAFQIGYSSPESKAIGLPFPLKSADFKTALSSPKIT